MLEPPYTSVAFVIPLPPPPNTSCVSLALTPDGSQLLVPAVTFGAVQGYVRIFNAPFSAASTFEVLNIPDATTATGFTNLQGIAMSPDGTKALVVGNRDPKVWAISAPFGNASVVEQIPLPAGFTSGFETWRSAPKASSPSWAARAPGSRSSRSSRRRSPPPAPSCTRCRSPETGATALPGSSGARRLRPRAGRAIR